MGRDPRDRVGAYRVACDSLVALASATADGNVLFAKNSDRPALECQPLVQLPRRRYAAGAQLRCTYIEIPQVYETARLIGSQPFWCWGFEHGLNEHGVAIGNHTVFSKDPLSGKGLIGMDLVRLGLERGQSASAAVEVITTCVHQYGQGGSGYGDKEWPYHNSFLVADRASAFTLETSDRHWAVRRITNVGSVSNHLTITTDWDALSDGAIEHAIAAGWWSEDTDARFDFSAAYRDASIVPEVVSSGRHRRTCELLQQQRGRLDVVTMRRALRDHYGCLTPGVGCTPAESQYFSVCMHAEPVGTTTASVIASLPAATDAPLVYWASLGSPCASAFLPLFLTGEVPGILARGGATPSDDSAWWLCKRLLSSVERDWEHHLPRVRARLDPFEAETNAQASRLAAASPDEQTPFMHTTVHRLLELMRELCGELEGGNGE